jgi:hypothetical protein
MVRCLKNYTLSDTAYLIYLPIFTQALVDARTIRYKMISWQNMRNLMINISKVKEIKFFWGHDELITSSFLNRERVLVDLTNEE